MNNQGFIKRNSAVHRLNPALKFIAFIVVIVMIFLPLGFFAQILIGISLLIIYAIAKLPWKMLWGIFKSVLILFALLLLINWAIYKNPIALIVPDHYFGLVTGSFYLNHDMVSSLSQNNSFVSNLWGGKVLGYVQPLGKIIVDNHGYTYQDIVNMNHVSTRSLMHLFDDLSKSSQEQLLKLTDNNRSVAENYLWVINNTFSLKIDGQSFKITPTILSNSHYGLLNNHSVVYSVTHWYTLSPKAVQLALYVSIKVFLMIIIASILTSTTSSIELTYALEDIFSPLKIFKFPVTEVSMVIAIALRFIPSLFSEAQRIIRAQASRGLDLKNGKFTDKAKSIVSLVVPLFSIAFQKAGELANAMDSRSYNPKYARSRYRIFKVKIIDWVFLAFLCSLFGFLIGMVIVKMDFSFLGIFELGALLG